jgi:hypothetical protein
MTTVRNHQNLQDDAPRQTARIFYPGDRVQWLPPAGAFCPQSAQALAAGKIGSVLRPWGNEYVYADIGGQRLVCSVHYLERVTA